MDARRLLPLREQRPSSSATGWLLGTTGETAISAARDDRNRIDVAEVEPRTSAQSPKGPSATNVQPI
jgi:hypothetical protein